MTEPIHIHTNEEAEYRCPDGHVTVNSRNRDAAWFSTCRGHCSRYEEWRSHVDDHRSDWPAILDDNLPADPTFFELTAQRITDWNRLTNITERDRSVDNRDVPPEYPRSDDFAGLVPWVVTDAHAALRGAGWGMNTLEQSADVSGRLFGAT